MRPYLLLIFTAVILAFYSGKYILKFQGPGSASSSDLVEITKTKLEFQKSVTPYAIVNFSSLYYNDDQLDLLNPALVIDNQNEDVLTSTKNCSTVKQLRTYMEVSKENVWEQFRCQNIKDLPFWFFKRAPFMHPSGSSYAYLYFRHKRLSGNNIKWDELKELLSFFHLKELATVQREVGPLGGIYGILAGLDEQSIYNLINREGTILTKEFLLARINYPRALNILEYRFYLRDDLNNFLETTPFQASKAYHGKTCLYVDGPICWRYNVKHLFQMISFSTVFSFVGIVVILFLILWLLFSKIRQDKNEENRRKMALQVLTHEFRTPVASLILIFEKLNRKMNEYNEETQEDLLRLSAEIYRLQRLTEKSKHYLQGQGVDGLVNFNFEVCDYVEDVIYDVIAPIEMNYDKRVNTSFKKVPKEACLDLYWFQIIIKNLVENAFAHGQGEVSLSVDTIKDTIQIVVSDEGESSRTLDELTKEFIKGNKSQGSGLGLSIVSKVIKEWGGTLKLIQKPTTFTLVLPLKKK
ncbi:ATP-binding protein [Bacteriovorax sp. Seq25_V]|uniref:ATP-binding protein n=1 Tax=Bacteriovorax sp. Seq25_V TaxID=1201288 RepID=UPI00038A2747|nr:ATP-binding protein [Bacteriovorax sp. Seq25_V]EQC43878.1 PF11884 domain protein [Bacteriovorax sp. Seq25_V]